MAHSPCHVTGLVLVTSQSRGVASAFGTLSVGGGGGGGAVTAALVATYFRGDVMRMLGEGAAKSS
jgi:hypothetical protein